MSKTQRVIWPLAAGIGGIIFLTALYFGIVSLAESPAHAVELFWQDRWIVIPIILGFGIQVSLYTVLKKRLFVPVKDPGPAGAMTGAGGATSTAAMVACCAHHVTDVLPILGLSAAASFLAEYRLAFMIVGLGTTVAGILVMLVILYRERRRAISSVVLAAEAQ